MAERDDGPEGWGVRYRPAVIAAVATPAVLVLTLWGTGRLYVEHLRPATHAPIQTFPAPVIETFIHDGGHDRERPRSATQADPAIAQAKRDVVADGIVGWGTAR